MSVLVVGAGIVGLAVARQLLLDRPGEDVKVVDKEAVVAAHQTGHNSGVIHAGIYYTPGSLKAELCRRGRSLLTDFCLEQKVPVSAVGKLVVALNEQDRHRLTEIHRRAEANGATEVVMMDDAGLREIEPHVAGIAALHSPATSIVDFAEVSRALAADIVARGGRIILGSEVTGFRQERDCVVAETTTGELSADRAIVCGGLQSANLAEKAGSDSDPRIIPFRGEYYQLSEAAASKVRGLVYPVPDPRYPFLGIHLTRRIGGTVDVGPNAVPALALQGYRRWDISVRDLQSILGWPGFWTMARKNWKMGTTEIVGSLSKRYFAAQARRYLPDLTTSDLLPWPAGVRAQAVRRNGELVDDFWITAHNRITLVRNAPSPAATSALAIAEHICAEVYGRAGA
ncbi:L-2-hydroxyglutarate oxidase [Arthrobacter hankyongi]|uniref:L-2-hydroxyglutarate oxidase n=1 Tax=Arthrobacter hankyongi TaxID=2904801 RepID=UPI0027E05C1C|nr:L-2-hydroxyglutarate oxidase [Arthrobacter hankyongi]